MNFSGPKIIAVAVFLLLGTAMAGTPVSIRGRVLPNPGVALVVVPEKLQLLLKSNGTVIGESFTGPHGEFVLTFTDSVDSLFDLFCIAPGADTLFLHSITAVASVAADTPIQLLFPCEPDTTAAGDIICPKCHKEDQVYPIVYGEPIIITRHFDTTGKLSYERTENKKSQPDTFAHVARYYCRRDKINF